MEWPLNVIEPACAATAVLVYELMRDEKSTLAEVERYTRAAEQERLARQAIKKQSENESGKLRLDKVANTTDELIKINSLISKVALPRGLEPLFSP